MTSPGWDTWQYRGPETPPERTAQPPRAVPGRLEPVGGGGRVVALDALRGVAILGILLVNITFFMGPWPYLQFAGEHVWQGADRVAEALIVVFAQGKFMSMFAFLFGLGLAIQASRAEQRGRSPRPLLVRRLAVLAVFGAIHALLIWFGDVLFTYALAGLVVVLAFLRRAPKTLLVWAGLLLGVPTLLVLLGAGLVALASAVPEGREALTEGQAPGLAVFQQLAADAQQAYGSGTYADQVAMRVEELRVLGGSLLVQWVWALALMLAGLATGRARIVEDLGAHRHLVRRVATVGLTVGVPLNIVMAVAVLGDPSGESAGGLAGQGLALVAAPLLALGYLAAGALLFTATPGAAATRRLSAVGRMALTNYLAQSVIATAVFYGLRLYGEVSLVAALGFTLVVWALQLLWSPLWLARFRYGPMEWLWRRLTYGSLPGTPTDSGGPRGATA